MSPSPRFRVLRHLPRVLLSLVFLVGAIKFILNFEATTTLVQTGLTPWGLAAFALPATVIAIALKLGGSVLLFSGWRANIGAWLLILFTVLATLMYHMHWSGSGGGLQLTQFLKNLAIIGGLLLYAIRPSQPGRQKASEEA